MSPCAWNVPWPHGASPRPPVWQQGKPGLDAALAEAITLAVDDVVLGQLLGHLEAVPLARHLLVGAAVYRLPIDDIGLGWQVGDEQPLPADPDRDARLARLGEAQQAALAEGRPTELETLGLPSAELTQLRQDLAELAKPPLRIPLGFEQAKAAPPGPRSAGSSERPRGSVLSRASLDRTGPREPGASRSSSLMLTTERHATGAGVSAPGHRARKTTSSSC